MEQGASGAFRAIVISRRRNFFIRRRLLSMEVATPMAGRITVDLMLMGLSSRMDRGPVFGRECVYGARCE
jgi:hypothetical protein